MNEKNPLPSLELAPTHQLTAIQDQKWLEENNSAIAAYNKSVDESGVFSDGLRGF